MHYQAIPHLFAGLGVAAAVLLMLSSAALAHCDTMDGPVISAAKKALETGDASPVLIWVQEEQEAEAMSAFQKAVSVRKLGPEAMDLADNYFFETIVRLHRAGEGEPYTGIKPAGLDLGPAIPAADKAIQSGDLGPLEDLVLEAVRHGLHERFEQVNARMGYKKDDVASGREYVNAYVEYVHYVEMLYEMASGSAGAHHHEATPEGRHQGEP